MVQQHILGADRLKQIGVAAQRRRGARGELGKLEVRPFHLVVDGDDPVDVDRPGAAVDVLLAELEVRHQHLGDRLGAALGELQAHRPGIAATGQLVGQRGGEVLHLLLVHHQLAVARHAELVRALDRHAREHLVDELLQDAGEKDEIVGLLGHFGRQADDARQRARRPHQGHVALAAEGVLALEHDGQVEALVEDARERMGGIQTQRRQHRQDLVLEVALQPAPLLGGPAVAREEADALGGERRLQCVVPELVLCTHQIEGARADARQHLGRRHAVGPGLEIAEHQLVLEYRDAHFEELVEVGVGDAQESQPLQQGHALVLGLRQHAEVELELGQLAVDVQRGVAQVRRNGGGWGLGAGVHGINVDGGATLVQLWRGGVRPCPGPGRYRPGRAAVRRRRRRRRCCRCPPRWRSPAAPGATAARA